MKTALRVVALVLTAIIGLWALGHGIALIGVLREPGHEDVSRHLIEGSIFIAGGVCVLSVAIERLECMRTPRKDGELL